MNRYKKLLSNTVVFMIGQMSSKLLSFLLVPLYTSVLSTEEYGSYDLIIITVTLLTPILTLVVSEAVLRFCVDKEYDNKDILSIGLYTVLAGSIIIAIFYPIGHSLTFLSGYYWWIVVLFFLINTHTVLMQYLKGVGKTKFFAMMGVLSTLTTLIGNIIFLLVFKWGLTGYFIATTLSHLLVSIIIFLSNKLWNHVKPIGLIPLKTIKDIFRYSIPMMPNSISWWVSNSSDKYMITFFISKAAVGLYSVGYKIPSMLSVFLSLFISAFQLSMFEELNESESRKFFKEVYKIVAFTLILLASVLTFSSKYIALILYKNEFYSAWQVGCILILAFVFNSLSSVMGTIYTAKKQTGFLFYSTTSAAIVNIIGNFILIPIWGIYGAAVSTLISYFCVWTIRAIHLHIKYKINVSSNIIYILFILIIMQIYAELQLNEGFNTFSARLLLGIFLITFIYMHKTGTLNILFTKIKKMFKLHS